MKKCLLIIIYILILGCSTSTKIENTSIDDPIQLTSEEESLSSSVDSDSMIKPADSLIFNHPNINCIIDNISGSKDTALNVSITDYSSLKLSLDEMVKEAFTQLNSQAFCNKPTYSMTKHFTVGRENVAHTIRRDIYIDNILNPLTTYAVIYIHMVGDQFKEVLVHQGMLLIYPSDHITVKMLNKQSHIYPEYLLYKFHATLVRTKNISTGAWLNPYNNIYTDYYLATTTTDSLKTIAVSIKKNTSPLEVYMLNDNFNINNPYYVQYKKIN